MRAHPIVIAFLGWLLGSFFGLTQLMGLFSGVARPKMAAPAA